MYSCFSISNIYLCTVVIASEIGLSIVDNLPANVVEGP
ncbi:hypothetical protein Pint_11440 [Pistacia integerrima]|uniref:Uncharacterized protein n=1 Tax=Pistacia integerrima TaxID=434235 RepID=A0ACC0XL52_9ROSI|nr:hypothetical protein Pint_11440 [Pistacia integerrima]